MARYAVSQEGVTALKTVGNSIVEATAVILQKSTTVISLCEEKRELLGPHKSSIQSAMKTVLMALKVATEPITVIKEILDDVADAYEEIIDNDRIKPEGNTVNRTEASYPAGNDKSKETWDVGASTGLTHSLSDSCRIQTEHKSYISDHEKAVLAVQEDVRNGTGQIISKEQATEMLDAVQFFSGNHGSTPIRKAYNNPAADPKAAMAMNALDEYIRSSPKWKGQIFRGINVSKLEAKKIMSQKEVDMLGPASWSSEQGVAERFSTGYKDVRIVFVLGNNRSGASITHIGSYNGAESEVTCPSGVQYHVDNITKIPVNGSDIIYIDVHE